MPATPTPRLKLPLPDPSDPADVPSDLTKLATPLDTSAVVFGQAVNMASRPAPGVRGRVFAHQPGQTVGMAGVALSYDNGAEWSHVGSSCPILNQPAGYTLNTNQLPPNTEVDEGQEIQLSLPTQSGGVWTPPGQTAARWYFKMSQGYWIAVNAQPSISIYDLGSFVSLGALAVGAWYGLGANSPRVVFPIPGAYEFEIELAMIYSGGMGAIDIYCWWNDFGANTAYAYAGTLGSGAPSVIGQPGNVKARNPPWAVTIGYLEPRLFPTVNGATVGWRRASIGLHPIWLPGNPT